MSHRRRTTVPEGRPGGGAGALLLPYGAAADGRLVRACAVPAGLACGCACPACGAPLIARRGQVLAAHFAHAAPDRACAGALETALHRLAKQLIADGAALTLPEVAAEHDGVRHVVRPATTVRPETATLEPGLDGLRPDVVAVVAGRPLLVEVAVTHACGPAKIALIRQRRLAAIEIDLSWLARGAPEEAVERAVLHSAPRRWLWNRHAEAAEAEMRGTAARLAARRARAREEALGRVVRELTAAAAAAPRAPADRRMVEAVDVVRGAGLGGAVGTAVAGDGCFVVAREVWQSRLVARHVLGGIALDLGAELALLRPLLRRGFAVPAPGGFGWPEITARCPTLRPPSEVVADYARALGVLGLLACGADGLWRAAGRATAAEARGRYRARRGRGESRPPA